MCLIAFALNRHPRYSLVLAANRDEYLIRETEPAHLWQDAPQLLAGRDRQAGGTWLGLTVSGKVAAITNYRDTRQQESNPPSRGTLVAEYLRNETMTPARLHALLLKNGNSYDGFNLLYGTVAELHYFTNRGGSSGPVQAGIHALSNHLLDSRWPKQLAAKARLEIIMRQEEPSVDELLQAMADPATFADEQLPDTGIGPEAERFLSPIFIRGEHYATRSTSVILAGHDGDVTFIEQNHDTKGIGPARFTCRIQPPLS